MSASWRTRWRSAWSAAWRSIASARTLAAACRKGTSLGEKRCGSVAWTSRTPKGWSLPSIITARLLAAPNGAQDRRHREALLARPVGDDRRARPESSAAPAWESRAAETRRPAPTTSSSRPARRLRRRPSRPSSQMQALWTPSISPISEIGGAHQRVGVAVLQRPLAELGDHRLLGERPLQVGLGGLALADVVEDAVPDRHPVLVGLEHRLVEHPDDAAARGCASGTRPGCVLRLPR